MGDDVVERAASAIREHVEPSHPDTIDIIIGVDDAAKAALAALKPGDKVGDGCVVVPVERLAKHLSEDKSDNRASAVYYTDDGLCIEKGQVEWRRRERGAREMLTAAFTEGGE